MKYLALGVVIVVMLLSGCSLLNDEIKLVSPKDGAILNLDDLSRDTSFHNEGASYTICYLASFQWKVFESRMPDGTIAGYAVYFDPSSEADKTIFGLDPPFEESLCIEVSVAEERGRVSEDSKLVPDTTIIFYQQLYWYVEASVFIADEQICEYVQSETWSFTVVKDSQEE